jgi:WD40 repeat protein
VQEVQSTYKPRKDIVYSNLEFSPDGKLLAWGSWDTGPNLWDSKSEKLRILDDEDCVKHIRFSPDGQIIAASGYALLGPFDIKLWDVKTGKLKSTLQGHSTTIDALAFGPDGKHLASSDIYGVIKIWEISKTDAREIASFKGHYKGDKWGAIRSLAYSPNGKYLVSGGDDKRIVIWDAKGKSANAKTREIIASLEGHSETVLSLVFSKDGKYLLSAGSDVKLWAMPE